ncbi:MAG: hypothetical protein ACT4P2_02390 [Pseudomonadota bacterium]
MKSLSLVLAAALALATAPVFAQTATPPAGAGAKAAAVDCKKAENAKHADCVKLQKEQAAQPTQKK